MAMTPEEQARAMLADELEREGHLETADHVRRNEMVTVVSTYALRALTKALSREEQVRAEEGERAAIIWRRGVADTISAVDTIRKEWGGSKSKARREVAAEMDARLQQIFDARLLRRPATYEEVAEAGDALRGAAIRSAPSSQRGD